MDSSTILKARGLGIIAVVWGHVNPSFGTEVGLFHMPLFFVLGGLTLSVDRPWRKVLKFIALDLLLFAVAWTFAYAVAATALEPLGLHFKDFSDWSVMHFTTDILVRNAHHVPFALTCWFLLAYAAATLVCEATVRLLPVARHRLLLAVLATALFWVAAGPLSALYKETGFWPWNYLSQVAGGSAFMLVGCLAANNGVFLSLARAPGAMLLVLIAFRYFAVTLRPGDIGMVWSEYPGGPAVSAVLALLGTLVALQLATIFDRLPGLSWLDRIGKASKQVMIHHLFVFTLLNLGFVALGLMQVEQIETVFSKFELKSTWPLYVLLGVAVPWLLYEAYLRLRPRRAVSDTRAAAARSA